MLTMKLNEIQIRYLLMILRYKYTYGNDIKSIDIACEMDDPRALTYDRLEKLKGYGLITKEKYGKINFTEKGLETAIEYKNKYLDLYIFFREILKLNSDDSINSTYAFLSNLSEDSLHGMQSFVRGELSKRSL